MMKRLGEEILADIDATLDQLIQNAEVFGKVSIQAIEKIELEALQKTQESLLAHLMHVEGQMAQNKKEKQLRKMVGSETTIQQKIGRFSYLNHLLMKSVALKFKMKPRVHRNKLKTR